MRTGSVRTSPKQTVTIGSLHLSIQNAHGHEHRIGPIAGRAASIFASGLESYLAKSGTAQSRSIDAVSLSAPVPMNLRLIGDEDAAQEVASAWFEAVRLQLKGH